MLIARNARKIAVNPVNTALSGKKHANRKGGSEKRLDNDYEKSKFAESIPNT